MVVQQAVAALVERYILNEKAAVFVVFGELAFGHCAVELAAAHFFCVTATIVWRELSWKD